MACDRDHTHLIMFVFVGVVKLITFQWTKETVMASFQLEWFVYQQDDWLITDHTTLADKLLGF